MAYLGKTSPEKDFQSQVEAMPILRSSEATGVDFTPSSPRKTKKCKWSYLGDNVNDAPKIANGGVLAVFPQCVEINGVLPPAPSIQQGYGQSILGDFLTHTPKGHFFHIPDLNKDEFRIYSLACVITVIISVPVVERGVLLKLFSELPTDPPKEDEGLRIWSQYLQPLAKKSYTGRKIWNIFLLYCYEYTHTACNLVTKRDDELFYGGCIRPTLEFFLTRGSWVGMDFMFIMDGISHICDPAAGKGGKKAYVDLAEKMCYFAMHLYTNRTNINSSDMKTTMTVLAYILCKVSCETMSDEALLKVQEALGMAEFAAVRENKERILELEKSFKDYVIWEEKGFSNKRQRVKSVDSNHDQMDC